MTLHQIVTLASIVEQEAQVDEERPTIAGVYQNRITKKQPNGGLLQADPTIVYANDTVLLEDIPLDQWVQFFFWDVSKIKTRLDEVALPESLAGYQTYRRAGLIPGPICTPSVASIAAALAPETKTNYLFFVAIQDKDGKRNGKHAFARTLEEHEANLRKYFYVR
jgi:UPF0755 protein